MVRIEPGDGDRGVFRDALVLVRVSHPVDPATLSAETFRVVDPAGPVPARLETTPDGHVLIWRPARLLLPGAEHVVTAEGLRDRSGREVATHRSCFTPGGLARDDLVP